MYYSNESISSLLNSELDFTGYPNPPQLAKINQLAPLGLTYSEDEVWTIPILATNNLIGHNLGCWDLESIETMAKEFIGRPLTLDHEWYDVEDVMGIIYDSRIVYQQRPPAVFMDMISRQLNEMIVEMFGFSQLILYCSIPTQTESASKVKYKQLIDTSIGGYTNGSFYCPLCTKEYGEKISFEDKRCPHHPPTMFNSFNYKEDEIAPFYIRGGFTDAVELSYVLQGNIPSARGL
jgi:hypothetical protein